MEGGDGFGGLTVRSFFDRSQSEAYLVEYTFPRRHGIAVLHVALHAFSSYKGIVPSPSISRNTSYPGLSLWAEEFSVLLAASGGIWKPERTRRPAVLEQSKIY